MYPCILSAMPLKAPRRLPRHLRRPASSFTRSLARKYCGGSERAARRRRERLLRFLRRIGRGSSFFLSEFRVWLLIGITVVLLTTATILLFAPIFDVREIHVRRQNPRIDIEEIQQILTPLFKQRLLLITKGQVASMLQAEYPDIERVEIGKEYPSSLIVSMYLEPVVAAVTIEEPLVTPSTQSGGALAASGAYMYVTKSGIFVISPIKLTSSLPIEILRVTDWGIRPQNRTRVISPSFLQTIFSARDILRTDFGLAVKDIVVYLRARELHIRTNRVTLWFDLTSPLPIQFQRFREFLKSLSLDQVKEYIDLRVADKIVYK